MDKPTTIVLSCSFLVLLCLHSIDAATPYLFSEIDYFSPILIFPSFVFFHRNHLFHSHFSLYSRLSLTKSPHIHF